MVTSARSRRSSLGAQGEARTAAVLDGLAGPDTVVLHSLSAPGFGAGDLDHVVLRQTVVGAVLLVVDSKLWKPGLYLTAGSRTYRGLQRFRPAEHVTTSLAAAKLSEHLGIPVHALVVIWPSHPGQITSLGLCMGDGTPWCRGERLARTLARMLPAGSGERADAAVVAALRALRGRS